MLSMNLLSVATWSISFLMTVVVTDLWLAILSFWKKSERKEWRSRYHWIVGFSLTIPGSLRVGRIEQRHFIKIHRGSACCYNDHHCREWPFRVFSSVYDFICELYACAIHGPLVLYTSSFILLFSSVAQRLSLSKRLCRVLCEPVSYHTSNDFTIRVLPYVQVMQPHTSYS